MTVLPYVTVSIVESLGSLAGRSAASRLSRRRRARHAVDRRAGLRPPRIPLTFPHVQTASFFSTTLLEQPPAFDFVDLYIPSNPFYSLANNVVPAVVLFSIVLGVAVIGADRKPVLLDVLRVARVALSRATRFIVQLTPYGLFAIAAVAAGTLSLDQIGRLQVFLVAYVGVSLLVGLWVLPGLVAAVTPIRCGDIFALTRDALITAFVAGDLFIVLPVLIESSRTLVERAGAAGEEVALPDVIVPASFNFPTHRQAPLHQLHPVRGLVLGLASASLAYPRLALTGLVTFFGSINCRGAVSARPVPRPGRHVSALPRQQRHQLPVRHPGRGDAYAGGGPAQHLRDDRADALRTRAHRALLDDHRGSDGRRHRRHAVVFGRVFHQEYTKDKVLAAMHLKRQTAPATVHRVPVATASRRNAARSSASIKRARRAQGRLHARLAALRVLQRRRRARRPGRGAGVPSRGGAQRAARVRAHRSRAHGRTSEHR